MNIQRNIWIPSLLLLTCVAAIVFFIMKNKHNDYVSIATFTDVEILDKYEKDGSYYVTLDLQNEHYKEQLYLNHTIRTFKVNPDVYPDIKVDTGVDVLGMTVETVMNKKDPRYDEELFTKVPFVATFREEYSDYNCVVKITY